MAASDDLSGMLVSEALDVLKSRKSTGHLSVVSTYREVAFRIVDGKVAAIQSNRPADRLGLQMMKAGDIALVDLHGALVEQHQQRLRAIATDTPTSRLGEILVDRKVLDAGEFDAAFIRYVQSMTESLEQDVIMTISFEDVDEEIAGETLGLTHLAVPDSQAG